MIVGSATAGSAIVGPVAAKFAVVVSLVVVVLLRR